MKKEVKKIYSVKEIIEYDTDKIILNIKNYLFSELLLNSFSKGQLIAWKKSIELLKNIFTKENSNWKIIFEFVIPLSSGKRPDILILNGVTVLLIEIKNKNSYSIADLNQIRSYELDLTSYHSSAKNFTIKPLLVLLNSENICKKENGILVISKDNLKNELININEDFLFVNPESLFEGEYRPIPSITEYAKSIFNKNEIKNIEIPEIKESQKIHNEIKSIYENIKGRKKGIIFVKGEAGTGKSAIGLNSAFNLEGLYVTKNRQFSEHLSQEIGKYSNIKTTHNFVNEYKSGKTPSWNVVVFDEAQRFFPNFKMKEYFNIEKTEQQTVIDFFTNKKWCLLIILIGFGQELAYGEYNDLEAWELALKESNDDWEVYGTKHTCYLLSNLKSFNIHKDFDLYNSFRNLRSSFYPKFVNSLLEFNGDFFDADFLKLKKQYQILKKQGFNFLITRSFDKSIEYCQQRFGNSPNSYCTLASTEADVDEKRCNDLNNKKFKNGYKNSNEIIVNKYLKNNALDDGGCYSSLTEFTSIGFEVEMPIIIWGHDFLWYKNQWNYDYERKQKGGTIYRKNTYRIFLTRGKTGVILFFPLSWEFDNTFNLFYNLGADII